MWITFSASAPESADSTLDCTPDFERWAAHLERSATSRGKHSRSRVWVQRFKKGGWTKRLFGAVICENYPPVSCHELTGSPGDTPVNHSAKQESGQGPTTRDTCGPRSSSLFGAIDPPACCSRTSQAISRWGCSTSCPTWKTAVTERRGAVTRRRLSALHTDGNESSSSGWPTVTANQTAPSMQKHPGCRAFWPTPDCTMRPHEGNVRLLRKGVEQGMDKAEADAMLGRDIGKPQGKLAAWPTPMTRDHKDGTATYDVPTNGHLGRAAPRDPTSHPGQLNPDWVEMLMGFPIGWTDCAPSGTQ